MRSFPRFVHLVWVTALTLTAACVEPVPDDPSSVLFEQTRIIEIAIELSSDDWTSLRNETPPDYFERACSPDPETGPRYTYFPATVTIDGERITDVAVRKKAFWGSFSTTKPALKVKFDEYVEGLSYLGLKRLTLNNNIQDPSNVHQCLAYRLYADAGIPAPRCNFAHVTVNGTDLGLYTNVESVKKSYLRRHFADDEGNLYEGTISDFLPGYVVTFDKKTNEADPDRSDLDAVTTAAATPDSGLYAALDQVVDMEKFLTLWALEVILGHWDGYAGNTNNFYIYNDPTTGRFTFMPWGVDQVFIRGFSFEEEPNTGPGEPEPIPMYATGVIASRLYGDAASRTLFEDELRNVLATVWDETALLSEIDRMETLITPVVLPYEPSEDAPPDQPVEDLAARIEEVRDFVRTRSSEVLSTLASVPPPAGEPRSGDPCNGDWGFDAVGEIGGTFSTTFGTLGSPDPFAEGTGTVTGIMEDTPFDLAPVGVVAGFDPEAPLDPEVIVELVAPRGDGTTDVVILVIPGVAFESGTESPVFGVVLNIDPAAAEPTVEGFLEGFVELYEAGTLVGANVSGSFQAVLL